MVHSNENFSPVNNFVHNVDCGRRYHFYNESLLYIADMMYIDLILLQVYNSQGPGWQQLMVRFLTILSLQHEKINHKRSLIGCV